MIKFFRKFRKNMIAKGNIGKYLKYSIGEIFLVVIGILLALQINTWNQTYKDSKTENLNLRKLRANLETDTTNINVKIKDIELYLNEIALIEREISDETLDQFSIDILRPLLAIIKLDLETTTWENLKSTGQINLIGNSEVIDEIQDYYKKFENTQNWMQGFQEYNRHILAPKFFELDDFSMFDPNPKENLDKIQNKTPYSYSQNTFFRNAIRYRKGALKSIKGEFEGDLTRAKNVLSMIKEELNA